MNALHRAAESAGPLEPGKEYDFKIIKISPSRAKSLSYKAAVKQVERQEIAQYRSTTRLLRLHPLATC
jgi:hypothetical protein